MKKKISFLLFVLFTTLTFAQTYYYNTRKSSIKYTDSYGKTQFKLKDTQYNTYKFVFELSADGRGTQLYTVYKNGEEQYWAAEISSYGYQEIGGVIFKKSSYLNTGLNKRLYVFISEDNKKIVTLYDDELIEYY